jgi:hypothetical protein
MIKYLMIDFTKVTHIELDTKILNKPIISFFKDNACLKQIFPKPGKEYEVLSIINKEFHKELARRINAATSTINEKSK